jgi:uroporphyrinogen decarboxylase
MTICMTPRERVWAALEHREVDRTPIDLGGTPNSTMCRGAYESFKAFLGVEASTRELSKGFNTIIMDEAVLRRLPVDTRAVFANAPARPKERWLDDDTFVDEWDITYRRPEAWSQFDMVAHPLAEATMDDLETYDWPDVDDEGRYAGLGDRARDLHENTDYAIVGATGDSTIFDTAWMLRGMEQFLTDLLLAPTFAQALMERIARLQMRRHGRFLEQVGQYIDVIMISDDMGTQNGLLISPTLYRKMVKPLHRQYVRFVKERTDAKVAVHACGSIVDLVEDYVEIGVDALNPMQVTAANMSPQVLRDRFGGRMAFWGGIDTQDLLPRGRPEDVRQAVRDTVGIMGLVEGGYILGAVHNVQDDVPPENVWAMLDEAANIHASDGEGSGP